MTSMSTGIAASSVPDAVPDRHTALMHADAVLPADVQPAPCADGSPRIALLTGATGFLGRYAARSVLRSTDLRLVCLVRGNDDADARSRLHASLARVGVTAEAELARIEVVRGEIGACRLGIEEARYFGLAAQVDRVYHCAAEVNWARSYRQLRSVNVLGALEVLRFACEVRAKPLAFVSTIAVCFAQGHGGTVNEDSDLLPLIGDMPLGYAQSKCVAERLLRQAAARGLPVTILRPALISGDSATGDVNPDDLIAALVEGCVASGTAIDADWLLDCVPVDFVADVLARAPIDVGSSPRVLHLVHERPRHWREIVLWMNLYGHPVRLQPESEWIEQSFVSRATSGTRLFGYRRFFLGHPSVETRPFKCYLEPHQRRVASSATTALLETLGLAMPSLDAALMHRYFERYRHAGMLPPSPRRAESAPAQFIGAGDFEALLRQRTGARSLRVVGVEPLPFAPANGVLNDVSSARVGMHVGIRRYKLGVARADRARALQFDVLVKTKAADEEMKTVSAEIAGVCNPELGRLFERHRDDLGLNHSHDRELALYEVRDARLRRHTPRCLGTLRNLATGSWTVALEYVRDADTGEVGEAAASWDGDRLRAVVQGLGAVHSIDSDALGVASSLLAPMRSTAEIIAAAPLFEGLIDYAATTFVRWSPGLPAMQRRMVDGLPHWWPEVLAHPHTLVHNDFNPRNVALRRVPQGLRLCAFDWELAGRGLPQRDLAEFLCFVAGSRAGDSTTIAALVESHRSALLVAGGPRVGVREWRAGFVLGLRQFMMIRLPMYALIHRFRPQPYLPSMVDAAARLAEVVSTWGPSMLPSARRPFAPCMVFESGTQ